ncbi:MAG: metallophosphoesterase [Opitutaceae bacterium]|nr:metallophosphoesterase [Opitutaceae bacterium]
MSLELFDRSLHEPALLEFALVADSHFTEAKSKGSKEFPSRAKQKGRAEMVWELVADLKPEFVLHMGDVVQEYPGVEEFRESFQAALAQMQACNSKVHFVAGNHDVGDKPDLTMPTHPVEKESLEWFHQQCGRSWYAIEKPECHLIIINSQILNTGSEDEKAQQAWLEQELEKANGKRIFLFLHLPLYLGDRNDEALGHYDVISEPARSTLLELVKKYRIELIGGAHVHFAFLDRIEGARYFQFASPAFTRPGFGYLFQAPPPPERGRDDRDKLGIYLIRVLADRTDVHFIWTSGLNQAEQWCPPPFKKLLTPLSAGQASSPLGISLRQPLSSTVEIPIGFPNLVRPKIRNDYPLLLLLESGTRHVRVPLTDWDDPFQSKRLSVLSNEGVEMTVTTLATDLSEKMRGTLAQTKVTCLEWQIAGSLFPEEKTLKELVELSQNLHFELSLAPVIPGEIFKGKQHPRTRVGYTLDELSELNQKLQQTDISLDRALCRIHAEESPAEIISQLTSILSSFEKIQKVDLTVELPSLNDQVNLDRAAEALFHITALPGARIFFDPLVDMDRTMDISHGLLDPLCNPRDTFTALRTLNAVLFTNPSKSPVRTERIQIGSRQGYILTGDSFHHILLLSSDEPWSESDLESLAQNGLTGAQKLYHLAKGNVFTGDQKEIASLLSKEELTGPLLLSSFNPQY